MGANNTHVPREANKKLKHPIEIWGAHNRVYVHFKLGDDNFYSIHKGAVEQKFSVLDKLLSNKMFVVDLTALREDGVGSQYTFLEAVHNGCALILNAKWFELDIPGEFNPFVNCYTIEDSDDLVRIMKHPPNNLKEIAERGKEVLKLHELEVPYEIQ